MEIAQASSTDSTGRFWIKWKPSLLFAITAISLLYRRPRGWVTRGHSSLLVVIVILVLGVPRGTRLTAQFRWPGTPFLDAAIERRRPRVGIWFALLAVIGCAIFAEYGNLIANHIIGGVQFSYMPGWKTRMVTVLPGQIATVFLEEAAFRLSLFPIIVAWLSGSASTDQPSSRVIWSTNVIQALAFGAAHILPHAGLRELQGIRWYWWLLITPHAWFGGFIQGILFWRFGLETAVLEHAVFNAGSHGWGPPR